MPIDVIRMDSGKGLLLKCHGSLKPVDKIELNKTLLSSPGEIQGLRYIVIDEESAGFQLSTSEMYMIAEQDKEIAKIVGPGLVVAIVTPQGVNYGMARMWQVLAEDTGWNTRVFSSMDDVGSWLQATIGVDFVPEQPLEPFKTEPRRIPLRGKNP